MDEDEKSFNKWSNENRNHPNKSMFERYNAQVRVVFIIFLSTSTFGIVVRDILRIVAFKISHHIRMIGYDMATIFMIFFCFLLFIF